jgi:hypothetical protein
MKYLLMLEIGAYEDYSCKPIAIFDDTDAAKRWAQLDSATVINDLNWEPYGDPIIGWSAWTGTRDTYWDVAELPENPEPGTRLG